MNHFKEKFLIFKKIKLLIIPFCLEIFWQYSGIVFQISGSRGEGLSSRSGNGRFPELFSWWKRTCGCWQRKSATCFQVLNDINSFIWIVWKLVLCFLLKKLHYNVGKRWSGVQVAIKCSDVALNFKWIWLNNTLKM